MTTVAARRLSCPLCTTSFDGWIVLAGRAQGPKTTDLRQYSEGEDPLPRQINGCPSCALTGEAVTFEDFPPSSKQEVRAADCGTYASVDEWDDAKNPLLVDRPAPKTSTLGEQLLLLRDQAQAAHEDAALRYEHHAHITRWTGGGPLREGDAWLRAAWMHEDRGGTEEGLRCRRQALATYLRGIEERTWFGRREDLVVVAYLIGELSRRLGQHEEAKRWFEQCVAWSSGLPHLESLVELAERQGRDPRDLI